MNPALAPFYHQIHSAPYFNTSTDHSITGIELYSTKLCIKNDSCLYKIPVIVDSMLLSFTILLCLLQCSLHFFINIYFYHQWFNVIYLVLTYKLTDTDPSTWRNKLMAMTSIIIYSFWYGGMRSPLKPPASLFFVAI